MKKEMFSFMEKKFVFFAGSPERSNGSESEKIAPIIEVGETKAPDATETAEMMTFEPLNLEVSDSGISFPGESKEFVKVIDSMIRNYELGEWAAINWQILGVNDNEANVRKLQKVLGFSGKEVDGMIGPKTLAKLKEYLEDLDFDDNSVETIEPSIEFALRNFESLSTNYLNSLLGTDYKQLLVDYEKNFEDVYSYMSEVQKSFGELPLSEFNNANIEKVSKTMAEKLFQAFSSIKPELNALDFTDDVNLSDFTKVKKQVLDSVPPDNSFFKEINSRFKDQFRKL
ncbi:MAG: hypothetical protein RBS56_03140 [Candidatus Gracilibacteria bacterium]|jgi:hypothetical protein|nr:hypothetical protein [Candidatus Gracilibacteria bacterium]